MSFGYHMRRAPERHTARKQQQLEFEQWQLRERREARRLEIESLKDFMRDQRLRLHNQWAGAVTRVANARAQSREETTNLEMVKRGVGFGGISSGLNSTTRGYSE